MKPMEKPAHVNRKPLSAAILGGIVAVSAPTVIMADTGANPWAASKSATQAQPLKLAACNPCNPCNPCATKRACGACNPCNPCAAKNPCNPCNPCAVKKNPCSPCNPCNPCNPCKTS